LNTCSISNTVISQYFPSGDYQIELPHGRQALIGGSLVNSNQHVHLNGGNSTVSYLGACNYSVGVKSLQQSNFTPHIISTGQTWDPYWQYKSMDGKYTQSVEFNGVLVGGIAKNANISFRYCPNYLLHVGIVLSLLFIILLTAAVFATELRVRFNRKRMHDQTSIY
jgi:hypothetical protein